MSWPAGEIGVVLGKVDAGVSLDVVHEAVCGVGTRRSPAEAIENFAANTFETNLSVIFAEN